MSSVQGYSPPPTLTEEPDVEHVEDQGTQQGDHAEQPQEHPSEPEPESESETQQESEPIASSSRLRVLDRPPRIPPKDRDSEGRLSVSNPARFSQLVEWSTDAQPSLSAAAQLLSHNANRYDDPEALNMASARSSAYQPTGNDDTANNTHSNATGSTSNASNRNYGTGRRNLTTITTNANPDIIRPVTPNHNRSQVQLPPSRPLSPLERRPTGTGLISYDPIRGDNTFQASYLPDANGYEGGEDFAGASNRNGGRRISAMGVRSVTSPTDGTMVGNEPGTWSRSRRASRLMSGQDWLVGVPVVETTPKVKTVADRLKPTVDAATAERDRFQKRSSQQGLIINGAIGLQVLVSALITGVAASGSRHIGTAVAALGGLSTILASYLAKVRGSGEPEFSTVRARELNSFLREVQTFVLDHGDEPGADYDEKITGFRERFELIIKTDGEDSGGGPAYSQHQSHLAQPPPHAIPPPAHVANTHLATSPVHPPGVGNVHDPDEKQHIWKNEKTINGVA